MHHRRGFAACCAARGAASFVARALTLLSAALAPSFTENAVANGDTRTIYLYHAHTHEQIAATYLVNGQYDQAVLKQLNWFLRDWRRDEPTNMDPRLFDVVWEAYRQAGASEPINVVSAYRSPATNAMLRRRSRAVAKYSQHMLGKAMDTTMPGMSMSHIREIGMRMQRGGVGYYPNAGTPFVHLDVGSVRSWPRMSYEQLVRLFPDGKTVHLPTNNQPLARYDEAKAEIEARGGGAYAPPERKSKSFLAFLFGGGEEDEDSGVVAPPPSSRKQWASLAPRGAQSANLASDGEEEGASPAPEKTGPRGRRDRFAEAASNLPRGETTLSAGPAATEPSVRSSAPSESARLSVASLEQTTGASSEAQDEASLDLPLPPRRPAHLMFADAPLPPARPVEVAFGSGAEQKAKGGAIASLLDVAGTSAGRPGAKAEPVLAYAPSAETKNMPASDAASHPRPVAAGKVASLRSRIQAVAVSPARLDRSNFHMMTAAVPTSHMSSGSVLGPAIAAPRSAARSEPKLFASAPESGRTAGFAARVDSLPTDRFVTGR